MSIIDGFATAATSLRLATAATTPPSFDDVFVVVSQTQDGRRHFRQVLAGSLDDARQTHQEHHPGDQIVEVGAIAPWI